MSLVNGIGGAFIFSDDPKQLALWYSEMLGLSFEGGLEVGPYYQVFWGLDPADPARKLDTTFSILQAKAAMSKPPPDEEPESMYGDQPFMVNFRTDDMEALLAHLESNGVNIIKRQDEPYGRFAWVRDPDGNRVELYQPIAFVG
jgi:catechol 2,3-dioxygenase-like lactoylglutathione lyase family enzyme